MTTVALCEGFAVCQSVLGAKLHDAKDPGRDLGPMFRQVVGSLFALAGRYVDRWTDTTEIAPVPGFVLPVELWARICYDYLLAYNAQVVDHDQLVSSMIPLYFGRTATFVNEAADDTPEQAEERVESFAEVFLAAKPYLIERWSEQGRPRRLGDQRVHGEERRKGDDTSEFMAIRSP